MEAPKVTTPRDSIIDRFDASPDATAHDRSKALDHLHWRQVKKRDHPDVNITTASKRTGLLWAFPDEMEIRL